MYNKDYTCNDFIIDAKNGKLSLAIFLQLTGTVHNPGAPAAEKGGGRDGHG